MTPAYTVTVSEEKAIINATLNSDMLNTLLLGMYTPLYFGTMYICITGKASRNRVVLAAITILYASNVIGGSVLWIDIHRQIGMNGESPLGVLLTEIRGSNFTPSSVLLEVSSGLPLVVADGLLIWRCFRIWDSSLRIIALSLILFLAEIALFLATLVFSFTSSTDSTKSGITNGTGLFLALAVTLWTTTLIAYRIYSASSHVLNRKRSRFYNILEIITESSFIYSLSLVVIAVLTAIPMTPSNIWTLLKVSVYVGNIFNAITGIAPTITVARVALASNSTSDTEPTSDVSGVQSGQQSPDVQRYEAVAQHAE
ncbi:hypothetical protein HYPSUDRAFT_47981 [Hypholoma sublateritium FD-334 SS-4]|uniref:G-protein coupled receptors family 1 profile domain-containing protein n=1 Tax=Hypholoma sublateritium (strain FD-334 SS-4) TaxID=945553 RepID=A0A0D2P678_HYPSF|nr:hypothetical protein HYPSUDRAFT_47981 [Hypholoma sublateritium FD-334 SS-4]